MHVGLEGEGSLGDALRGVEAGKCNARMTSDSPTFLLNRQASIQSVAAQRNRDEREKETRMSRRECACHLETPLFVLFSHRVRVR